MPPINLRLVLFIALWTALSLRRLMAPSVNGLSLKKHAIEFIIIALIAWAHPTFFAKKNQRTWRMAVPMVLAYELLLLRDAITHLTTRSTLLEGICFALSIVCITFWFNEFAKADDRS